ncbi:response regulator receiver protein [Pelobium manganitolerans]|uniref:Response regulator receiver protein n=1 Tax=Pelobium manganitolerans TaxID=1842495 RepID=A0A419S440_9SPHI|nr:response regulator [Pelobium manganitolerans]RKD14420.1 response regulator receiver protein [Pelobium manganitolerans]
MKLSFIVIDDRELDCFIAEKLIQKTGFSTGNNIFNDAVSALDFIRDHANAHHTVILVDIMMPIMDGFEFIEAFERLPDATKANYKLIAITTSLNKNDESVISNYPSVVGILKKPYSYEGLLDMIKRAFA